MAQSGMMARALEAAHTGLTVEMITITTQGDRSTDRPLTEIGGAGLFVKELEQALLDDRVDLAVHSLKDLASEERERLGALSARTLGGPSFVHDGWPRPWRICRRAPGWAPAARAAACN